ncbi:small multi-drug export protein [Patescibacteria group bacterium]|nr:small multi-drug export protein [Patescibacteria group bacterium]
MINELTTILVAAAPISELRGAIPLALEVFDFSVLKTLILVWIGNFLPVPIILYFLGPIEKSLRNYKFFDKFFVWLYKRTRHKFEGKYLKWGEFALVLFVAIPLPITGAWTGSLAAYLFGIPKKYAIPLILLGILIASMVVTILDLGVVNGLKFL